MKAFAQNFSMLADQPIIPDNRSLMMASDPRNTADRGFLHAMLANDFHLVPVKMRVVERRVFRLNEVFLAVLAEILLIPGTIPLILHDIFSLFDQEEKTFGILAGDRTVTARTGHAEDIAQGK